MSEGDGGLYVFQVLVVFHQFSLGGLDDLQQFIVLIECQPNVVGVVLRLLALVFEYHVHLHGREIGVAGALQL